MRFIQITYALVLAVVIGSIAYAQNPQIQLNQGSVTAGQQGNLTLGAVSPTSATFVTGTTMPMQLDTNGNVKVTVATGVSVTVGTVALTTSQSQIGIVTVQSLPALATGSNIVGYNSADPCSQSISKLATAITGGNGAGVTNQIIASPVAGKKVYICSMSFIANAALNFSLWEGTGSGCSGGTVAIMGSTAATAGEAIATQGGFTLAGALGTVAQSSVASNEVCVVVSPAAQFGGNVVYVQQ